MAAPSNEPVNLDMSAFAKKPAQDEAMNTSLKSDSEIINDCLQKHVTFSDVMQKRLDNTTVVMNYILKNDDMKSAIKSLEMI